MVFEWAGRGVRDRDADKAKPVKCVEEVILTVFRAADVWGKEASLAFWVHWVLVLSEDDAFVTPIGKIV